MVTSLQPWQTLSIRSYGFCNGPWGLDTGDDYGSTMIIDDRAQDRKVSMAWAFKDRAGGKPFGYFYQAYGNYWNVPTVTPVKSLQLGKLNVFDFAYDISVTGQTNLLAEFIETVSPGGVDQVNNRRAEIGWYLSTPPQWFLSGKLIGNFSSRGGHTWEVRSQLNGDGQLFIMICPSNHKPLLVATVDALSGVKFLISKGLIDPSHYINGHAIGFEPTSGIGGGIINRFQVPLS